MKRLTFLLLFFAMIFGLVAQTRTKMQVWSDGFLLNYIVKEIDSITFREENLELSAPIAPIADDMIHIVWNTVGFKPCLKGNGSPLVFAGDYNNWNTEVSEMVYFEPIEGYDNWWHAYITPQNTSSSPILRGIPCALVSDGTYDESYSWANLDKGNCEVFYTIEGNAWINNELELCVANTSSVVYIRSYGFKNDPCKEEGEDHKDALENAIDILTSNNNGWEMAYFPHLESGAKGYNMMLKFNKNGNVSVTAKNPIMTQNEIHTDTLCTWEIKNDYGPTIAFNNSNDKIYPWANPDVYTSYFLGDREFYILKSTPESIVLKGKKYGAYSILRPINYVNFEEHFAACLRMDSILFSNNNVIAAEYAEQKKHLHNGHSGCFMSSNYGEQLKTQYATYYPLCTTEDGIIISIGFNENTHEHIFYYDSIRGELRGENGTILNAGNLNLLYKSYFKDNAYGWMVDTTCIDAVAPFLAQVNVLANDNTNGSRIIKMGYGFKQSLNMYEGGYFILVQVGYKLNGKGKEQVINLVWTIDMDVDENRIIVSNPTPYDEKTEKWIQNIPIVQEIIESIIGTFTAEHSDNLFNAAMGMKLVGTNGKLFIKGDYISM